MGDTVLKIDHVTKRFPGVLALDDVGFEIEENEIHALVGENGAGKSTLMNIIMGVFPPDEGVFSLHGEEILPSNPHQAQMMGLGIVPQELNLVQHITVAENILIGLSTEKGLFGKVNWKEMFEEAKKLVDLLNINVNVKEKTIFLSPAQQTLVQVARSIALSCKVLILDEPTASLTEKEIKVLFSVLNKLKENGTSIIYISHKLEEIFQIADRVCVLRDGQYITTKKVEETNEDELVKYMVGRDLLDEGNLRNYEFGETLLEVKNISSNKVSDISFKVKRGEIVGFAGLVGAGRTELINAIFGVDKITQGDIFFQGKKVSINSPKDAIKLGMGLVPEERRTQAILPLLNLKSNLSLPIIDQITGTLGKIKAKKEKVLTEKYIDMLKVKTPSIKQKIANLSGGNQQKVIIGRWLASDCKLIIFDEPTRGIDVGAKKEIHELIYNLSKKGMTVLVVSSEFQELFTMTNRIYVMSDGKLLNEYNTEYTSQKEIMSCILENKIYNSGE